MISVTCTLDANGGMTSGGGLVGVTESAPTMVWYAAGVIVKPSTPSVLPFASLRIPVAFWFSSLCTNWIASNVGSSSFLRIEEWVNIAVMFSIFILAILASWAVVPCLQQLVLDLLAASSETTSV
eukprot:15344209-Ditylum_brightwellii.AAC.1